MKYKAFLFDFDGVIADTEHYYTDFWTIQGRIYFPEMPDFANQIKGRSLKTIYEDYFSLLEDAKDAARELYNLMFEYGWYTLEEEASEKGTKKIDCLEQKLIDLGLKEA